MLKVNTKIIKSVENEGEISSVAVEDDSIVSFYEGGPETGDYLDMKNKEKCSEGPKEDECEKPKSVDGVDAYVNINRGNCGDSFSKAEREYNYEFQPKLCVELVPEIENDDDVNVDVVGENVGVDDIMLENNRLSGEEDEIVVDDMIRYQKSDMCAIKNVGENIALPVVESENKIDKRKAGESRRLVTFLRLKSQGVLILVTMVARMLLWTVMLRGIGKIWMVPLKEEKNFLVWKLMICPCWDSQTARRMIVRKMQCCLQLKIG